MSELGLSGSEPSLLRGLSEQQQVRLTELLDSYLQELEEGRTPNREALLDEDSNIAPELKQALDLYLDKLSELYQLVDGRPNAIGCDLKGKVLGDFRLDQEIGRGGMGIVFNAFDQSLKRQVAVKLLPMAAMLDPKYVDRFCGEARAAASLEHPNIVPIYAIGEVDGIHYYAMRLITGKSLDQRIRLHREQGSHAAAHSALLQFADIADALHEVHQYGIVHRDIKPSNLLLDTSGKLWVADFGLARFQSDAALTRTGEMIGTMRYMSPEQAQGRGELVDHRTDIYSLGATLYEFLTGQPAVQGEEGPALLRTLTTQTPVRLRKLRPDLPADFQLVIEKAMARHRDDRYATASDFATDLRRAARGETVSTRLVSPVVLASRWVTNHPRAVSVMIATLAMLALLITTGFYMHNRLLANALEDAYADVVSLQALETDQTIDSLAMIPGAESVRQELMHKHLQHYQDFVERPQVDPKMRAARARAYHRLGTFSEELGQLADAVLYYEQAEQLFAQLVSAAETHSPSWRLRSKNLNSLALALRKTGHANRALPLLQEWMDALEQIDATVVASLEVGHQLALTENNYGLLLQKLDGRSTEARRAFESAIETLTRLQQTSQENPEITRTLAAASHNLGSLLASEPATHNQALKLLSGALQEQIELAKAADSPLRSSIDLVATYISLGNLYLEQEPRKAAIAYENAVEIGRKLVEISPRVDDYRRDLAVSLSNLGMALYRTGKPQEARAALKESVHRYRGLLVAYPDHAGIQYSLGIALNNQGIVLQHIGESQAAEEAYVGAARLLEASKPVRHQALNNVYENHLRMLRDAGRDQEVQAIEKRQLALRSHAR